MQPSAPHRQGALPLQHALMPQLVVFNLLPSLTLHPDQRQRYTPPSGFDALLERSDMASMAHRHWSASILGALALTDDVVCSFEAPALSLAMCNAEQLEMVAKAAGLILVAHRLRRMVARAEVTEAIRVLGESEVRFARARGVSYSGFVPDTAAWDIGALDCAVNTLGRGVLARAFSAAPLAIHGRAMLRLSPEAAAVPQIDDLDAGEALALALQLLMEREPQWLSLFPSVH